jgi:octaheme c-type cytochrome (tetrathionate reductase family)
MAKASDPTTPESYSYFGRATPRWAGFALVALTILGASALTATFTPTQTEARSKDNPRDKLQRPRTHTDHRGMMRGPLANGPAVTRACLRCHAQQGRDVLHSQHYTWLGREHRVPGEGPSHQVPIRIGKKNLINNFCLSVESNWARCTSCHPGYGWKDAHYDFEDVNRIDCLVCHEQTGSYRKELAGLPAAGTDLLAAAESVARPSRSNCGYCHFAGGGGDAVKHGDLDATLSNPPERIDVHMGRGNLVCVDCHRSPNHQIFGQSMGVSTGEGTRIACTDCHDPQPHRSDRLNQHTGHVACVTCHVPLMAVETPTKMVWDWSTAGMDTTTNDPHRYLKEKGSFVYARRVVPEYFWYGGRVERNLKRDPLDPGTIVDINRPIGSIGDKSAKIWPFKVHRGKQPYDRRYNHLLVPQTYGEGGYWTTFDWSLALKRGSEAAQIPFSGEYGFVATRMFWPLSHMVPPAASALGCHDCHDDGGRLDWKALGYEGDPALSGGRFPLPIPGEGRRR